MSALVLLGLLILLLGIIWFMTKAYTAYVMSRDLNWLWLPLVSCIINFSLAVVLIKIFVFLLDYYNSL